MAYARLSERRKARPSDGLPPEGATEEGALPDATERECVLPLPVEGAFMVSVVCAVLLVLLLVEVFGGLLTMPMLPMFESPANVGAAVVLLLLLLVLLANALDSRRVMPMPPVLLGEAVVYRLLPPTAAPLPPTALDSGVALDL